MKPFLKPLAMNTSARGSSLAAAALLLIAGAGLGGCAGGGSAPAASKPAASNAQAGVAGGGAASSAPVPEIKGEANDRFQQAVALMRDHKADEAQAALEALTAQYPNYSGPLTDLGILYARAKQRDKAFTTFNKAIAANPKNATAHEWEGIIYRESGDYPDAEQAYLRAVAADPNYASAHLNLAILYDTYLRRPQDAVAQYREYQRLSGGSKPIVTAWINEIQPPAVAAPAAAAPAPGAGTNGPSVTVAPR